MKPPVKDITIPTDLKLYSDMRAVERAEFDHQVRLNIMRFGSRFLIILYVAVHLN